MSISTQKEELLHLRDKLIKHKENTLKKDLADAYSRGDFSTAMQIIKQLMEMKNKRLDNINSKLNNKLTSIEQQLQEVIYEQNGSKGSK